GKSHEISPPRRNRRLAAVYHGPARASGTSRGARLDFRAAPASLGGRHRRITMTLYHGGCQCGAVRYRGEAELDGAVTCNCSRCQRLGSVLVFAPRSAFTLEQGEGATTEYLFASRTISHRFCTTCGIESFAYGQMPDGTPIAAINVNCLDEVD